MNITLLCSDVNHPIFPYLDNWVQANSHKHNIQLLTRVKDVSESGDILFLVSCSEIVKAHTRDLFQYCLVLHASDLPEGRGWSPHVWDILSGKDYITLSLLDAEDKVDTGDIWQKKTIRLDGTELYDDINQKLFDAELELITWASEHIFDATPEPQKESQTSYYRKRTPSDSELDPKQTIEQQFNLLRVCDPNRFPAFITINNTRYNVRLEKADD
ncbi:formyltransferase family protein [Vibrio breoganii]|uniref:formyltransferase family protein n=1 Tax=Vibrio breoganii TaxID=553239 RepID=UPI000CC3BD1A|nr:formyltransferase family protein [Vibrio breoganii]PML85158.1 UDP-glucuronic acid dehydrogenase [Vibrio breoganii]